MASLKHNLEYLAARAGAGIARMLSPSGADRFGVMLGDLAFRLVAGRRKLALENLKAAFGDKYSEEEYLGIAREVFRSVGRTLIELSRFPDLGHKGICRIVHDENFERVKQAQAEGKGGIILTAHFGNWELLGASYQARGIPMDFLVANQSNQKVDRLLNSFRTSLGTGIIPVGSSAKGIFKTLRSKRFAGLAADQHAPAEAVVIDFFGREASVAKGPSLFALRCNSPIFMGVLVRESYDRHILISDDPIYPPLTGNEDEDVKYIVTRYIRFLERCITKYPHLWLWTHNRWKPIKKAGNRTLKVT